MSGHRRRPPFRPVTAVTVCMVRQLAESRPSARLARAIAPDGHPVSGQAARPGPAATDPHPYNADMSFPDWGLPFLSQALRRLALTEPTPVQAEAYPAAMARRDVLAQAQTGSGKDAGLPDSFAQPMAGQPDRGTALARAPRCWSPTRELALQVGATLADLTEDWRDRPSPPWLTAASPSTRS